MLRIHRLLFFLSFLFTLVLSANTPDSFCKCTCLTNSTIIPLHPQPGTADTCSQCKRAFCLSYNLPICKDIEEAQIKTDCFQRDSAKDRVIVWAFILGTAGLLGWAGLKRLVEMREGRKGLFGVLGGNTGGQGRGLFRRGNADAPAGSYTPLDDPQGQGALGR